MTTVQPGQIWVDNDKREQGRRRLRVLEVRDGFAFCEAHRPGKKVRRTRINLSRFRPNSTGYRLVEDA